MHLTKLLQLHFYNKVEVDSISPSEYVGDVDRHDYLIDIVSEPIIHGTCVALSNLLRPGLHVVHIPISSGERARLVIGL